MSSADLVFTTPSTITPSSSSSGTTTPASSIPSDDLSSSITPTTTIAFPQAELFLALKDLRARFPFLGIPKVHAELKRSHPHYAVSQRRLARVIRENPELQPALAPGAGTPPATKRFGPRPGEPMYYRTCDRHFFKPALGLAPLSDMTFTRKQMMRDSVSTQQLDYILFDKEEKAYGVVTPHGTPERNSFLAAREVAEKKRSSHAVFMLYTFLHEEAANVGISNKDLRLQLAKEYGTLLGSTPPPIDSDCKAIKERFRAKFYDDEDSD